VLTGFVFDEQQSEQVEDWRAAIERLDRDQLLWLALHDPTEQEVAAVRETLDLGEALALVATILDWIVSSYLRALDDVERELEDLDARS